jgi:hypothetical protein
LDTCFTWNSPYYNLLKYLLFLLKHSVCVCIYIYTYTHTHTIYNFFQNIWKGCK